MKGKIIHYKNNPYSSTFVITKNHNNIGEIYVKGDILTKEASIIGNCCSTVFGLRYKYAVFAGEAQYRRPYSVSFYQKEAGEIFYTQSKENSPLNRYTYIKAILGNCEYRLYTLYLDDSKITHLLYKKENTREKARQIAMIEKNCTIYNNLHHYNLVVENEEAMVIASVFASYLYVTNSFQSRHFSNTGITELYYSKTTNPTLLKKYNSEFTFKYS